MKPLTTSSLFLSLLVFSSELVACSCAPSPDTFCQSIRYNDHVALVKVISKESSFMHVEILESIRNAFSTSSITVIGQDGLNCSEWLDIFEVSDTLVLGLGDFGMVDTFNLSLCGRYYLFYENGNVTGNITPSLSFQSYTEFRDNFELCAILSGVKEAENQTFELLFLNGSLSVTSLNGSLLAVQIFATDGKILVQKTTDQSTILLNVEGLKPSVYLLRIHSSEGLATRKLFIQ